MQLKVKSMLPVWLVILLIACQEKAILQVCPNQDLLYTQAADSLPVFNVGENKALYPFLDSLVEIYKQNEDNLSNGYFVWRDSVDYLIRLNPFEWIEPPVCHITRNRFSILLNAQGQTMAEGKWIAIGELDSLWKLNQSNYGRDPDFSDSPEKAFAEIKIDSLFPVDSFSYILSRLQSARNELVEREALNQYDSSYCRLNRFSAEYISFKFPLRLILNRNQYGFQEIPLPPPVSDEIEF